MELPKNPLLPQKRLRGGGWDESEPAAEDDFEDAFATLEEQLDGPGVSNSSDVVQKWGRPSVDPGFGPGTDDLNVQWLDIDMTVGQPLAKNPKAGAAVVGSAVGPVPIIRIYGCSDKGHSVGLFIHGFTPYAFFAVPEGYENSPANLQQLRDLINDRLRNSVRDAK
ncbi:hypothetical protein TeGR_g10846, partial [Tetraparma gracilis]